MVLLQRNNITNYLNYHHGLEIGDHIVYLYSRSFILCYPCISSALCELEYDVRILVAIWVVHHFGLELRTALQIKDPCSVDETDWQKRNFGYWRINRCSKKGNCIIISFFSPIKASELERWSPQHHR